MEISGKLVQILAEQSGDGKNGRWSKCDFIIQTQEKYPKKVCLTAWNELIAEIKGLPNDTEIKVSFDISSREYNSRWYTDVKAWKVEVLKAGSGAPSAPARSYDSPEPSQEQSTERYISEDDLPF